MARVAIVTGGTRGIGEAISVMLRDRGMTVAANYAGNKERADEFTERTGIRAYCWDVSDPDGCDQGCARVAEELGPVDVLVNNAGITRDGTMLKMTYQMWKEVIDTNLGGCFNMAKALFPAMRERKWGRIVNIGSINGQAGQYGQVNYAAAKSGIHGFTKALAQEGARTGITVNAIAPGYIDTDMVAAVPGRRAGEDRRPDPGRPAGPGRRDRARGGVPLFGGGGVRDRVDAEHQRRAAYVLTGAGRRAAGRSRERERPSRPARRPHRGRTRPTSRRRLRRRRCWARNTPGSTDGRAAGSTSNGFRWRGPAGRSRRCAALPRTGAVGFARLACAAN